MSQRTYKMKKFLILFLVVFFYVSNTYAADTYTLDSVSIKVNNDSAIDCVELYFWQPWQKVEGTIKINENRNTIVLNTINKVIFFIDKNNSVIVKNKDSVVKSYILEDNSVLSLININNFYYFYINDSVNKIEIFYKINKISP